MELSVPRLDEDPSWFEKQLEELRKSSIDVEDLLRRQRSESDAAWRRYQKRFPEKYKKEMARIEKIAQSAQIREKTRSEVTRSAGVVREFYLQAAKLTDLGNEVFFLEIGELLDVLNGNMNAIKLIPVRKITYSKYCELPPYPPVINGRFDPLDWAQDPNKRTDFFDSHAIVKVDDSSSNTLEGVPGAAGRVEGIVRRIDRHEDGDQLKLGEILVTSTTNVGWTLIFPRAAAIITDIGASLSHAAIVARELGIPAIVGCGNATMHLKTGDRVVIDGGQGIVTILNSKNGESETRKNT